MFRMRYGKFLAAAAAFLGWAPPCYSAATEKVLYSFSQAEASPSTNVTKVGDVFYGATLGGGTFGIGTVYSITNTGIFSVIYSFKKFPDANLVGSPLLYKNGALYGVSTQGGNGDSGGNHFCKHYSEFVGCGTVFKITPSGQESILYAFSNTKKSDGFAPGGELVAVGDKLYGTTSYGGRFGNGTIFSVTTGGREKTLYTFSDGEGSPSALTAMNGVLYGATFGTCESGSGSLFSLTTAGEFTILHSFGVGEGYCAAGPMLPINGVLYGSTPFGGAHNLGTIFSLTPDGTETVIASLDGAAASPYSNLVVKAGRIYGLAGGDRDGGTFFRAAEQGGNYKKVFRFSYRDGGGRNPTGVVLSGGSFYGATRSGGASNDGTFFELTP